MTGHARAASLRRRLRDACDHVEQPCRAYPVDDRNEVDDHRDKTWITLPAYVFPRVFVHTQDPDPVEVAGPLVDQVPCHGYGGEFTTSEPSPSAFAAAETDILSKAKRSRIQRVVRWVVEAFGGATRSMRWRNTVTGQESLSQVNRGSRRCRRVGWPMTGRSVRTR